MQVSVSKSSVQVGAVHSYVSGVNVVHEFKMSSWNDLNLELLCVSNILGSVSEKNVLLCL